MLLFVLVNISATAGADVNNQTVTLVPGSSSAIYGYKQITNGENAFSASLATTQVKQPLTLLTSAELNALSADDTSYATQAGNNKNDEFIYVNFTLSGVQSVNWLMIKSITSASADTTQLGLWNSTSPAGGGWTRLNSTAITSSFATLTYNASSAADIQKYTKIDNNNLNFSVAVWTSGPSSSALSVDLFEVIINYEPTIPADTTPPASITNLSNISYASDHINWTWADPSDPDFDSVMVYLDGVFKVNVLKGVQYYNATFLSQDRDYTINTRTVDISGNINATWINHTAATYIDKNIILTNGDFESTGGWNVETIGGNVAPVVTLKATDGPYQGNYYAKITNTIGSIGVPRAAYIRQNITVPSDALTLNYSIKYYKEGGPAIGVKIGDTVLEWIGSSISGAAGRSDWVERGWNISMYRDQTVVMEISLEDNSGVGVAWIGVDNIYIMNETIPPASITNLQNTSYASDYINWTWVDPTDLDFSKVMIYLNGVFRTNVSKGMQYYNVTSLIGGRTYTLSGRTVDKFGNTNATWINHTAATYAIKNLTLINGDFESTGGWNVETIGGSVVPVVTLNATDGPYQGNYYAKITIPLDSPPLWVYRAAYIRQIISVPSDALTLNYAIKYNIICCSRLGIKIGDTEFIEGGANSGWVERSWNISSYRDQTVILEIFLEDLVAGAGAAWIGVDNIYISNDSTPPASITNLQNISYASDYINWTWIDPIDTDFSKVMIYFDGVFRTNISKGVQYYNATSLIGGITYTLSGRTVDTSGNTNATMVSRTASTAPLDATPPASITNLSNISYASDYINWTWIDPIDIDFSKVMIYLDGIFQTNVSKGVQYYNATSVIGGATHTLTGGRSYTLSGRTVDIDGNINVTMVSHTASTAALDTKPPASITNLMNISYAPDYIIWAWIDPSDSDYDHVEVYVDGTPKGDVAKGVQYYNATGFSPDTQHSIATRTVDTSGNINQTWINHTARTKDTIPPGGITNLINGSYAPDYIYWIWTDPADEDYDHVEVYVDGTPKGDVAKGVQYYNATGFSPDTQHTIATRTVDTSGNINQTWINHTARTKDTIPPGSITNLINGSYAPDYIYWIWTDPADSDYDHVEVYVDGMPKGDVAKGVQYYNATGFSPDTQHTIATRTVDTSGNINQTWINHTARTKDTIPPGSITNLTNSSFVPDYIDWTWIDPIDPDFSRVMIYLDGIFKTNVTKGVQYYRATNLTGGRTYTLSGRTVDIYGNINSTMVSHTASTAPPPPLFVMANPAEVIVGMPTAVTVNVTRWCGTEEGEFCPEIYPPPQVPADNATVTLGGSFTGSSITNASGMAVITVNAASAGIIIVNASKSGYKNGTAIINATVDTIPPASVTNLTNASFVPDYINWTWTDPKDTDFSRVIVYLNSIYQVEVPKGVQYYNATVTPGTYTIGTNTADTSNNINATMVTHTVMTILPEVRYINGTVIDNVTKSGLSGVTVSTSTSFTTTNASGFYSFAVNAGTYGLTAKLDPTYYSNNTVSVSTIESTVAIQNIELLMKTTGNITGTVRNV